MADRNNAGGVMFTTQELLGILTGVLSAVSYLRDDGVAVPIYRRTEGNTR